jgi:hypothetical protein
VTATFDMTGVRCATPVLQRGGSIVVERRRSRKYDGRMCVLRWYCVAVAVDDVFVFVQSR